MYKLKECRRTFLAFVGLIILGGLGLTGLDVTLGIVGVCGFVCSANASENIGKAKYGEKS